MRSIIAATITMLPVRAAISDAKAERIVDAIWFIEGGQRAKAPYGILSVKVKDKDHARAVCKRTVINNYRRWEKAGKPGRYFDFLADRYCPPSADRVGNRNWKRNIRALTGEDI